LRGAYLRLEKLDGADALAASPERPAGAAARRFRQPLPATLCGDEGLRASARNQGGSAKRRRTIARSPQAWLPHNDFVEGVADFAKSRNSAGFLSHYHRISHPQRP
jgi:hypothetical protein